MATLHLNAFLRNSQSCYFGTYEEIAHISQMGHNNETPKAPGTMHHRFAAPQSISNPTSDVDQPSRLQHLSIDLSMGIDHLVPFGGRLPAIGRSTGPHLDPSEIADCEYLN
jgi:hypothetical protein